MKTIENDFSMLTSCLTEGRYAVVVADRERSVKIWYDGEGDYLEVIFDQKPGYCRETSNDQVMERVDDEGNLLGFSVMRVSALKEKPLEVVL